MMGSNMFSFGCILGFSDRNSKCFNSGLDNIFWNLVVGGILKAFCFWVAKLWGGGSLGIDGLLNLISDMGWW